MNNITKWLKRIFSIQTIACIATVIGTYYGYKTYVLNYNTSYNSIKVNDSISSNLNIDSLITVNIELSRNKNSKEDSDNNEQYDFDYLISSAENGDVTAEYFLGCIYYNGDQVPKDEREAEKWFYRAADHGSVDAYYTLGLLCAEKNKYIDAINWYRKAAEEGDAAAQCNLGILLYEGKGVKPEKTEALKWLHKSADQNCGEAQNYIGNTFAVNHDFQQAKKWFQKAAEQGNAYGQRNLGILFEDEKKYSEAIKWYQKAAEQGSASAQYHLGSLFYRGLGDKGKEEGLKLIQLAAEKGDDDAIAFLKDI